MNHPMHLHGFYYRLDRPDSYDQVTHAFIPGEADELSWTADRAGSWMFHCHIDDHITRHAPLRDMRAGKADPALTVAKRFHHPNEPMGGMVVALRVLPRNGDRPPRESRSPRRLGLTIEAHDEPNEPYPDLLRNTLYLVDGSRTTASSGNLGPSIVLTRGQPVAIAVTNKTREQTSIHWHGIALEDSYYDGGSGMGMPMHGERVSPPIDPGATFVARFTPPDAGTFMYHAHMDDGWQLGEGTDGALVVMPPGEAFDPTTDHLIMISESYEKAGSPYVAIGGSLAPEPLAMTVGVPQRLRFAELSLSGENLAISLSEGSHVLRWTPIAKDGRDLPLRLQRETVATQALTIGETRDFRFISDRPATLTVGIYDLDNNGRLVAMQRIDVAPARERKVDNANGSRTPNTVKRRRSTRRPRNAFVVGRPDGLPRPTFVRPERFFEARVTVVLTPMVTHDDRFTLERIEAEEIAGAVCAEFADLRRERQASLLRSRVERPPMRNRIVQANRHAHDMLRRTMEIVVLDVGASTPKRPDGRRTVACEPIVTVAQWMAELHVTGSPSPNEKVETVVSVAARRSCVPHAFAGR